MREVFGAVIATALVLIAVFVPVAFFPGTTGRLYQQFALTIAFAVAISAFNAITLTPALSALLLKHGELGRGRIFGAIEATIVGGTRLYVRLVRGLVRVRWAVALVFVALLGATYLVYTRVPQAFLPEQDAGWFMTLVQAPAGASLEYTSSAMREAEKVLMTTPEVESVFSVGGFSFTGTASNTGMIFTLLKPFEAREGDEHRLQGLLPRLQGPLFGIQSAMVISFAPPAIFGLGAFGGFEMQVLDQTGSGDIQALASGTQNLIGASRQSPLVSGLFSGFTANDPQLAVDIDREKARSLGLPISEITSAMQIYLGSAYVNDFDFNNRAYRVYVQADRAYRSDPKDLGQYYARTERGEMVPLTNVVSVRETTGPQVINHFNLFRSTTINGAAAPGFSSGQAIEEMQRLAASSLPQGFGYAWSGISFEEVQAGGQSAAIFGIGLLLVYLTLAAAVRIADPAVHRPPGRAARGARGLVGAVGAWTAERSVLPDRSRPPDRSGRKERDPDRRVRRTAASEGSVDRRRRHRSGAHPSPADPDDVAGVHPGRHAARVCDRRRAGGAQLGGHGRGGRDDVCDLPQRDLHSDLVRAGPHVDSRRPPRIPGNDPCLSYAPRCWQSPSLR